MTDFQLASVVDAVNRMFRGTHFSICTVDSCMKITGAVRTSDYQALTLYHCVNYSDMTREIRDWVFKTTMENIGNVDSFPTVALVKRSDEIAATLIETKSRPNLLNRLTGAMLSKLKC